MRKFGSWTLSALNKGIRQIFADNFHKRRAISCTDERLLNLPRIWGILYCRVVVMCAKDVGFLLQPRGYKLFQGR
jgi:hypothetical protein